MKEIAYSSQEEWLNLRAQDVTSTEVSALFGMNPWLTEFELFHRKLNNEIVTLEDTDRMKWGRRLEDPIALGIAEDQGWLAEPYKIYGRDESIKAGSSFDYQIAVPDQNNVMEKSILEIKNVDSLQIQKKWIIEDKKIVEAPPHIELQCQHQLMLTGHSFMYLGALIGGNQVLLLKRTPNEKIISSIKAKIIKFWNQVENNIIPEPDFIRDADYISQLYNHAEPGKVIEGSQEISSLVDQYNKAAALEKEAANSKKAAKAKILTLIGDAEKVIDDKYSISAGLVGPTHVSYERKGFRNFRVFKKKESKDAEQKREKT